MNYKYRLSFFKKVFTISFFEFFSIFVRNIPINK